MNTNQRLADIQEVGIFNETELEQSNNTSQPTFHSWRYYQILHYTNAELYYLDDQTQEAIEDSCDMQYMTTKGIIYCFN